MQNLKEACVSWMSKIPGRSENTGNQATRELERDTQGGVRLDRAETGSIREVDMIDMHLAPQLLEVRIQAFSLK